MPQEDQDKINAIRASLEVHSKELQLRKSIRDSELENGKDLDSEDELQVQKSPSQERDPEENEGQPSGLKNLLSSVNIKTIAIFSSPEVYFHVVEVL